MSQPGDSSSFHFARHQMLYPAKCTIDQINPEFLQNGVKDVTLPEFQHIPAID